MRLGRIWIFILAFYLTGCSVVGKRLYYAPQADSKWSYGDNNFMVGVWGETDIPRSAEYRCSDAVLRLNSTEVGEVTYTVGPPLLPIFPTFSIFDVAPGEKGFDIFITTEGTKINPDFQQSTVQLLFADSETAVAAQKYRPYCHLSMDDDRWRCQYYYKFKKPLAGYGKFTVKVDKSFNGCAVPAIVYTNKDYGFFYPFFLPLPDEPKH